MPANFAAPLAGLFAILAVVATNTPSIKGHWAGQSCVGDEERVELVVEGNGVVRLRGQLMTLPELSATVRQLMYPRTQ